MKKLHAIQVFKEFDQKGRYVFTKHDMGKLFSHDNPKALDKDLNRLVKAGLIQRACRGVYVNSYAKSFDSYTIEHIAKALRRNAYNYISLESISESMIGVMSFN
jgi:predicted transcriptional regulator of viral defense system